MQRHLHFLQSPIVALWMWLGASFAVFAMCQWGSWQNVRHSLINQGQVVLYGDWEEKPAGHSQGRISREGDAILMDYTLGSGFESPYVGLSLRYGAVDSMTECLDLSHMDSLIFEIQGHKAFGLTVQLVSHLPNINPKASNQLLQASLPVDSTRQMIGLSTVDFAIPLWYRRLHKTPLGSIPRHLDDVCRIELVGGGFGYLAQNQPDRIALYGLWAVGPNYWGRYLSLFSGLLALASMAIAYLLGRQRQRLEKEKALVAHRSLELNALEKVSNEWEALQAYLLNEYENPDCNLELLAGHLKISKRKVGELIKQKTGLAFKEYLNKVRIKEACVQLKNPKLQIQTVAFAVGFGNVSHFNRVFKEEMSCSPKEWRSSQVFESEKTNESKSGI